MNMTPPRIIIAEDDTAMLEWLREIFERMGAEVIKAKSGADVLDVIINQGQISLAVVDVHIPPPSGLRVVALARLAGFRGPILLITAFPDPSLQHWSAEMEGTALLAKPFDEPQLIAIARSLGGFELPEVGRLWGKTPQRL